MALNPAEFPRRSAATPRSQFEVLSNRHQPECAVLPEQGTLVIMEACALSSRQRAALTGPGRVKRALYEAEAAESNAVSFSYDVGRKCSYCRR